MDLTPYVDTLYRELAMAADVGGEDVRALAERLSASLDSAARLVLLEALSAAAAEITRDLAPGSVDLRLRGREPSFVVTSPQADQPFGEPDRRVSDVSAPVPPEGEDATARISFRLTEHLKARVEDAAGQAGLSVNAWLVRAATAALESGEPGGRPGRRAPWGGQRYSGWVS
jgi:hypothetical protein